MCPNVYRSIGGARLTPAAVMVPPLRCVCGYSCVHPLHRIGGWFSSYLAGGDELERPEGGAHVRDVGLELVESSRNAGLDLVGLGPRGGVGGDLVKGLLRHDGRLRYRCPVEGVKSQASSRFEGLFLKVRGGLGQAAKARWATAAGAEVMMPQASRPTSTHPLPSATATSNTIIRDNTFATHLLRRQWKVKSFPLFSGQQYDLLKKV